MSSSSSFNDPDLVSFYGDDIEVVDDPEEFSIDELRALAADLKREGKLHPCLSICSEIIAHPNHTFEDFDFRGRMHMDILQDSTRSGTWLQDKDRLYEHCVAGLRDFQFALEELPDDFEHVAVRAKFYNALGYVYKKMEHYEAAYRMYSEAVRLQPEAVRFVANRAIALEYLKRFDEALEEHQTAIDLIPTHPTCRNNRGRLFLQVGDCEGAVVDLQAAIRLRRYDTKDAILGAVRLRLCLALLGLQRFEEAEKELALAYELSPDFPKLEADFRNIPRLRGEILQFLPSLPESHAASKLRKMVLESCREDLERWDFLISFPWLLEFQAVLTLRNLRVLSLPSLIVTTQVIST